MRLLLTRLVPPGSGSPEEAFPEMTLSEPMVLPLEASRTPKPPLPSLAVPFRARPMKLPPSVAVPPSTLTPSAVLPEMTLAAPALVEPMVTVAVPAARVMPTLFPRASSPVESVPIKLPRI